MTMIDTLQHKLHDAFCPTHLAVVDDSHKHANHAAAKTHGGAHIRLEMASGRFAGLNPVARHRLVYAALADDMAASKIHALQMTLLTPEEHATCATPNA